MSTNEALIAARDALEEIAMAGMSGTGHETEEGMQRWHARRAWEFISIAARALEPVRAALAAAPAADAVASVAWLDELTDFSPTCTGNIPGMVRGGKYVLLADVRAALRAQPQQATLPAREAAARDCRTANRRPMCVECYNSHPAKCIAARQEPAAQPQADAAALPVELQGVAEAAGAGAGFWRSCSGCHELNEGHATGPVSKVFKCALGVGCSECGGIGAIWDTTDYGAMADHMARSLESPQPDAAEPVAASEEGHPTNAYLFKYLCQRHGIELGKDSISVALKKAAASVQPAPQALGADPDGVRYRHLRACNSGSLVIVKLTGTGEDDMTVLTMEDADAEVDDELARAQVCSDCGGEGLDGDAGDDGRVIVSPCSRCGGAGRVVAATTGGQS